MNIPTDIPMAIPMDITMAIPIDIPVEIPMDIPMDIPVETNTHLEWLWYLYVYTHIQPSEEDFLTQINNRDPVYLVLYWNKLEHMYPRFLEEEMDMDAIVLMRQPDFDFFGIRNFLV